MSNSAVIAILLPTAISMSPAYDIHPALATMTVILPSNFAFILPIATPASALGLFIKIPDLKRNDIFRLASKFTRIGLFFNPARFLLAYDRVPIKKL